MAEDRRTKRTRRALSDALVALVLERGFTAITVEDVAERADAARATFYSHFQGKEDLFTRVTSDLVAELAERMQPAVTESAIGFTGKPLLELLRHARDERDRYRIVLRGEGDGRPLQMFTDSLARATSEQFRLRAERNGVTPRIDSELLARVWVGEQLAVLRWWVEHDAPPMPAEEVTRMLLELAMHGRYWASGFDAPS
ncbi:transcriptional regulator, TetR family [Actinopolyspora mzabensis]|uniref:Transcriptional regulator, TetR family n=1 Tax=Actinopolyspora mzabensis TaxID=995066 RepID=A0A1G9FJ34_ACTMZ|nr:TetR/AcrR family transcriptional regulator [Actinopolyspora mzabensis]SDK88337.1 transcriptional regulator, TetR family [Actinopolyspora mzabensis]